MEMEAVVYFFRSRLIRLNPKVTMTLILENANQKGVAQ